MKLFIERHNLSIIIIDFPPKTYPCYCGGKTQSANYSNHIKTEKHLKWEKSKILI